MKTERKSKNKYFQTLILIFIVILLLPTNIYAADSLQKENIFQKYLINPISQIFLPWFAPRENTNTVVIKTEKKGEEVKEVQNNPVSVSSNSPLIVSYSGLSKTEAERMIANAISGLPTPIQNVTNTYVSGGNGSTQGVADALGRTSATLQTNIDNLSSTVSGILTAPSITGEASFASSLLLSQISAPSDTSNRLYNTGGNLYWAGNLIGGGSVGNWTLSGNNVYRNSGSVGLGTTSPWANFSIAGSAGGTSPLFAISSSTASYSTSTAFIVDSQGRVGIGTNSPNSIHNLHIRSSYGSESGGGILIDNNEDEDLRYAITLSAGATSQYRRYIRFKNYNNEDGLLFGANASNDFVMYNGAGHVFLAAPGPDGDTQVNATGNGMVKFNVGGSVGGGTGGVTMYSGDINQTREFSFDTGGAVAYESAFWKSLSADQTKSIAMSADNTAARLTIVGNTDFIIHTPNTPGALDAARFTDDGNLVLGDSAISDDGKLLVVGQGTIGIAGAHSSDYGLTIKNGSFNGSDGYISFKTGASATEYARINVNQDGLTTFNASAGLIFQSTSGKMGIGTTSPAAKLGITQSANTSAGGLWIAESGNTDFRSIYMDTSGVMSFYGGDTAGALNTATLNAAGAWTNASDISYKENIVDLSEKYGLDTVIKTQPRFYEMKGTHVSQVGFIAQELKPIIPEVVDGKDGSMGISYGNLVAIAFQAIKELNKKFDDFASSTASVIGSVKNLVLDSLTSTTVYTREITADKANLGDTSLGDVKFKGNVCVDDTCVTKEQFKELLLRSGVGATQVVTGGESTENQSYNIATTTENNSTTTPKTATSTPVIEEQNTASTTPVSSDTNGNNSATSTDSATE